jgi:signal transduction histidine kinase
LGTPISSLIAWVEYLKLKGVETNITLEVEKDIARLSTITERFSKIGGTPDLKKANLEEVWRHAISYMESRSPKTVKFSITNTSKEPLEADINIPLFEWVIENLCKNAIDAMNGSGSIHVVLSQSDNLAVIDVTDTGKGIPKALFKTVFNPGFTTKSRGWGLGLSLAKRIIKEYHAGQIFVKESDPGKATTFRILLKKSN